MEDFSPRRRLFAADTLFLDCRDLEISSVKCEDRGIDLTYSVDGKTPYGSCVQIKLALNTGMAFKVFLINFLFFSIFLFALTVGCPKKYDNMRAQYFPILLGPLSKNIPIKTFSDEDFSKM
jgi:hypothetical protein